MTSGQNNRNHRRQVQRHAAKQPRNAQGLLNSLTGWLNSLSQHLPGFLGGPFREWVKVSSLLPDLVTKMWDWEFHAYRRVWQWITTTIPRLLRRELARLVSQLQGWTARRLARLHRLIIRVLYVAMTYAYQLTAHERRQRQAADRRLDAETRKRIKGLHQHIEREAVAGYKPDRSERATLITRVADLIVTDDPVVRALVKDVAKGALDLLEIDDPVLRIALGFAIRKVVDHLGIDRPLGELLAALLTPILGQPKPSGLTSVIADICARLSALEAQWADFMADGGPEVEQAGQQWQALTRPLADVALLAFFGEAVTEPEQWAREVNDTAGRVISDSLTATIDFLRKV